MKRYIAQWSVVSAVLMATGNSGFMQLWSAAVRGAEAGDITALEHRVSVLEQRLGAPQHVSNAPVQNVFVGDSAASVREQAIRDVSLILASQKGQ